MLAPTHLGPHCQANQTPLVSQPFSFAILWACILFDGNPKCEEIVGQRCVYILGWWRERRDKISLYLKVLAYICLCEDTDTCARNLSFHYRQWATRVLFSSLNTCLGPVGFTKGLQQIHMTLKQHL